MSLSSKLIVAVVIILNFSQLNYNTGWSRIVFFSFIWKGLSLIYLKNFCHVFTIDSYKLVSYESYPNSIEIKWPKISKIVLVFHMNG